MRSAVGDRAVYSLMKKNGLNLGGEKSGHIIFSDVLKTGDGIMTAIIFASVLRSYSLNEINDVKEAPFFTREITVTERQRENFARRFNDGIYETLGGVRLVIRASGTEPVIRFLAESEDEKSAHETLERLAKEITEVIE